MTPAMAARIAMAGLAVALALAALSILPAADSHGHHADGKPQVAIIGGGIGGAVAAHFLRQLAGDSVAIHVFERQHIGGRLLNFQFENSTYELGGSMVYEDNIYVRELADAMELNREDPSSGSESVNEPFALFDGSQFVFNQSSWTAVNMYRLFMRYGTAPLRFQGKPKAMFQRFRQIYELQANGTAFETPEDLLSRVGVHHLTQQSTHSQLEEAMGQDESAERFGSEFVAAVNRVNYNQGNGINALAGMVSMLPATDSRIFKVKGGNQQLPQRLLAAARCKVKYGWQVTEVRPAKLKRFELHAKRQPAADGGGRNKHKHFKWDQEVAGPYDAVIVATPLEHSRLRFKGVRVHEPADREYQKVTTTYVAGRLRPDFFNVETLPSDQVLVTEAARTPFSVISPLRRLVGGLTLYKLFSASPLPHDVLHALFSNATKVKEQDWFAYPHFSPPERFPRFQLAPGILYNNAWENAASAMEMSAIAGRNSALLAYRHITDRGVNRAAEGAGGANVAVA